MFLSTATLVAAGYGFTCPPRFMSVVCYLFVQDGQKLQFLSRAQSDWAETWWRPQVGIPDQRTCFGFKICLFFYIVNKQKNKKNAYIAKIAILENFSQPCRV
jgi:hypothetical protein